MYQHIIERGIVAAIRCRDTKLRVKNTFAFSYFALPLVLNSSLNNSGEIFVIYIKILKLK